MNTLYLEQLALLRQKRVEERAQLVRTGRKAILSLLAVIAVVALFIHFLFPVILGHPPQPLVWKGPAGDQLALVDQAVADQSIQAQGAEAPSLSLGAVHKWYRHQTQGIELLVRAVPRMVLPQHFQ